MATDPYGQLTRDTAVIANDLATLRAQVQAVVNDLQAALGTLTPGTTITPDQVAAIQAALGALNSSVAPFGAGSAGPAPTGPAPTGP